MALGFSIVVTTLDRREMVVDALDSIKRQNWPNVETIVVDGGSTDGTVELLADRSDVILLTGPDKGVYDAFNKGMARATLDIVGFLNSDDLYEPGSFKAVSDAFASDPQAQAVCGGASLYRDDRAIAIYDDRHDKALASPRVALIGSSIINARFFRRAAMLSVGQFSLAFRTVSDRDWLMRWYEAGFATHPLQERVYRYRQHPGSLTFDAERRRELEIRQELVALSRRWQLDQTATALTRRTAAHLEGRCRATLALSALRSGRIGEAASWFAQDQGRWSISALGAVARAGGDWTIRKLPSRHSSP